MQRGRYLCSSVFGLLVCVVFGGIAEGTALDDYVAAAGLATKALRHEGGVTTNGHEGFPILDFRSPIADLGFRLARRP